MNAVTVMHIIVAMAMVAAVAVGTIKADVEAVFGPLPHKYAG